MTRAEYVKICGVCTNRSFNPKNGVVCGLTSEIASFKGNCSEFKEDSQEVKNAEIKRKSIVSDTDKSINRGRYALFVIAGLYAIVGIFEGFIMAGSDIVFGIIDWIVAGIFVGLGIWSYKKGSLAMIIGLTLYILILLLIAVADPSTLIKGILWKGLIIFYLINSIKTAKEEESKIKSKGTSSDLLDQL